MESITELIRYNSQNSGKSKKSMLSKIGFKSKPDKLLGKIRKSLNDMANLCEILLKIKEGKHLVAYISQSMISRDKFTYYIEEGKQLSPEDIIKHNNSKKQLEKDSAKLPAVSNMQEAKELIDDLSIKFNDIKDLTDELC